MGNLVNQFIASQKPIVDNLQTAVDNTATAVYALRQSHDSLMTELTKVQNAMNDRYNIIFAEATRLSKMLGNMSAEQYAAKIINGEKVLTSAAVRTAAIEYNQFKNTAQNLKTQIETVKAELDKKTAELNSLTKQLSDAGAAYQAGLIKAQAADDASATQQVQSAIDQQQASNPEFAKIKAEADIQKAQAASAAEVAKQVAEQKAKNNSLIIGGIIITVIILGVVVVLIFKK